MSEYALDIRGAMREWRSRNTRTFDLMIGREECDEWDSGAERGPGSLVHAQEFRGPASGPFICYSRPLADEEGGGAALFGGVDLQMFGPTRDARRVGPVGLGLVDDVNSVPRSEAQALADRESLMFGVERGDTNFIHASSLLKPNGTRAVLVHAVVTEPVSMELFVWVLTHAEEAAQTSIDYARQFLNSEGFDPLENLMEYIQLPDLHPVGMMERVFDIRAAKRRRGVV